MPTCLRSKGGEEGEWSTWPFPMIKMLIWWSQRNKLNCLFQPSIFPGINQHHPHGDSFWRGWGKAALLPCFFWPPLWENLLHLSGPLPHAKDLSASGWESWRWQMKKRMCAWLCFSLTMSLPIGPRSFDLPIMHRDFKGTAGSRRALNRLALWDENHAY